MEYEFHHDTMTGNASAKFSYEHQVIGPWLEIEIGHDTEKLTALLEAIDVVESGRQHEQIVVGKEYSVTVSTGDVYVKANGLMNGALVVPESLLVDSLNVDEHASSSCGVDDFRTLLLSWARFIKKSN